MGLAKTLADAATSVITALDDLPADIAYHVVVAGAYDVNTDTITNTDTVTNVKGVIYKTKEQNQDFKKTTLQQTNILIASQALPGITPSETDYMVSDGIKYEIKEIKRIPSNPAYIFIVRAV